MSRDVRREVQRENRANRDVCIEDSSSPDREKARKGKPERRFAGVGVKTDGDAGADGRNRSGAGRDRRTAAEQYHRGSALELRLEKREWKVRKNNSHFFNNQYAGRIQRSSGGPLGGTFCFWLN
ncbi:hypothetical protein [Oceanispirochaeta sp.]|jgi:hypothetical protein|uniref:hypothetical protein n=1 Tax=Oceanispirochaeta sp. TaxID=2035350 RepID=UPI002618B4BB|nr:hypothetical protein [Oceanispirochaeta sp.]MDA3957772.1 hypothetical protein [Oceanispirochaeta sp.]